MATVISQVRRSYWDAPHRYLRKNHRIALRAGIIRDLLGDLTGQTILDLGSGNGAVSGQFADCNTLVLVDRSEAMLAEASEIPARRVCADLVDFFEPAADVTLAIGVAAHIAATEAVIASVSRNTRSGGRAIIQFSDADRPLNRIAHAMLTMRGRRVHKTRCDDIVLLARRHGLELVADRSHLLILPGMHRLLGRALGPYDRFVQRWPRLAAHGLDTLALFRKV